MINKHVVQDRTYLLSINTRRYHNKLKNKRRKIGISNNYYLFLTVS